MSPLKSNAKPYLVHTGSLSNIKQRLGAFKALMFSQALYLMKINLFLSILLEF